MRDLGNAELGGHDLSTEMLKAGWAKIKEFKREPTEDDNRRKDVEAEARGAGKGIWNPHGPQARQIHHMMPTDSAGFLNEWKGKSLDGELVSGLALRYTRLIVLQLSLSRSETAPPSALVCSFQMVTTR